MMAKNVPIALSADPDDVDDFDVSDEGLAAALADRALRRKMGRPPGSNRQQVALRIEKDVLARWRAGGPGWQSRMTSALRQISGTGFIIADAASRQGAGARLDQVAG
jgi:uncharacterized protein (DUF4415 family)